MPRETIDGALLPFADEDPRRSVIDVSWSREAEYVQIVTKMIDGVTGEDAGIDLEALAGSVAGVLSHYNIVLTDQMKQAVFEALADRLQYAGVQYVQMNRHGLNRLVRVARAARNQVFGKDE
jgi:hypothetical protein